MKTTGQDSGSDMQNKAGFGPADLTVCPRAVTAKEPIKIPLARAVIPHVGEEVLSNTRLYYIGSPVKVMNPAGLACSRKRQRIRAGIDEKQRSQAAARKVYVLPKIGLCGRFCTVCCA